MIDNKAAYMRAWESLYNQGQTADFERIASASYSRHYSRSRTSIEIGASEVGSYVARVRNGFPDIRSEVTECVGSNSAFALRWNSTGTHLGQFEGVPPTGRVVQSSGITLCRFNQGLLEEEWVSWDLDELLDALGVATVTRRATESCVGIAKQVTAAELRAAHRKFLTGVTVVTTMAGNVPIGVTVNAFMSVSLEPPLVFVAINRLARSHDALVTAPFLCVNILSNRQAALARKFATQGGDKFDDVNWGVTRSGSPMLEGTAARFEARIVQTVRAYTHTVIVAEIESAVATGEAPLAYMDGRFLDSERLTVGASAS